jgi:two-component system NarL family sensor kinase
MEAVQNAAKHSVARRVSVRLGQDQHRWQLTINDNGTGFDQTRAGTAGTGAGLANMHDRLDAVGGTVTVESRSNGGTTVTAVVPRTERLEPARPPISVAGQVS